MFDFYKMVEDDEDKALFSSAFDSMVLGVFLPWVESPGPVGLAQLDLGWVHHDPVPV